MACNTRCLHRSVIHPLSAELRGAAMAQRTFIPRNSSWEGRRDMVARFGLGICCNITAVMACRAIASCNRPSSTGMAHGSRCKGRGVAMAGIALRGGWDVRARLAGGGDAMAAGATPGHGRCHQRMIKDRT